MSEQKGEWGDCHSCDNKVFVPTSTLLFCEGCKVPNEVSIEQEMLAWDRMGDKIMAAKADQKELAASCKFRAAALRAALLNLEIPNAD